MVGAKDKTKKLAHFLLRAFFAFSTASTRFSLNVWVTFFQLNQSNLFNSFFSDELDEADDEDDDEVDDDDDDVLALRRERDERRL